MGMFDSLMLNVKCPVCGTESLEECQTKDLECNLETWNVGDFIGDASVESVYCIVSCNEGCGTPNKNYPSIIEGKYYHIVAQTPNGIVSGEYEIYKY